MAAGKFLLGLLSWQQASFCWATFMAAGKFLLGLLLWQHVNSKIFVGTRGYFYGSR